MNTRFSVKALALTLRDHFSLMKSKSLLKRLMKETNKSRRLLRGRHAITQEEIDDVLSSELAGIRFSMHPIYNPRVKTDGKTTIEEVYPGFNRVKKIEIGPQSNPSRMWLIDTILHEELEARIALRAVDLFYAGEDVVHARIYRLIARFVRMKGL